MLTWVDAAVGHMPAAPGLVPPNNHDTQQYVEA